MALRAEGRKLSFDVLRAIDSFEDDESIMRRSSSDPVGAENGDEGVSPAHDRNHRRKRKNRGPKKKKNKLAEFLMPEDRIAGASANYVLGDRDRESSDKSSCDVPLDSDCKSRSVCQAEFSIPEDPIAEAGASSVSGSRNASFDKNSCPLPFDSNLKKYTVQSVVCEEKMVVEEKGGIQNGYVVGELRQRNVNGTGGGEEQSGVEGNVEEERSVEQSSAGKQRIDAIAGCGGVNSKLESAGSLDWKQLMTDDPNCE